VRSLQARDSNSEATEQNLREGTESGPVAAEKRRRILILASHVIQYSSPIFRRMAQDPRLDLQIAYCSLQGAKSEIDPEFGVKVAWDTSVLDGYAWVHLPNRSPVSGLGRFFGLFNPGIWRLIRKGHFDAVILPGYFYFTAWIAIAAARWHGVPIIFATDAHDLHSYTWAAKGRWKAGLKRLVVRRIYRMSRAVLAGSSGTVQYLSSLGIAKERIVLTGNVIDNDWWAGQAAAAEPDAVRSRLRIPSGASITLFCGKLQPWKLPLDLLEAFGRAGLPNSYLIFAGDGPLRSSIEERAKSLKIFDRVRMLGFVGQLQMPPLYRASDLLVLPSAHDSFGYVVNEAMACGLPVAISDRVGAKFDLVQPGENGYIFPAGDVDALATILTDIHSDSEKSERMGAAARLRMETWSPQQYVDGLVRAIDVAIGQRRTALPVGK
jgi:glycosyltransferase involved in cell wall biosynthesis